MKYNLILRTKYLLSLFEYFLISHLLSVLPAAARRRYTARSSLLCRPALVGNRTGPAVAAWRRSAGWPGCRTPRPLPGRLHSCPSGWGAGRRTRPRGSPARRRR